MRQINPVRQADIDSEALAAVLRKRIEGEVRFDNGSRALYATDASNYRHVPIGVVIPRTIEDVVETIQAARRFGAFGMVIDMSKYLNRIVEVDPRRRIARFRRRNSALTFATSGAYSRSTATAARYTDTSARVVSTRVLISI